MRFARPVRFTGAALAAAIVAMGALVGVAPTARAHASLEDSDPAQGETLKRPPRQIVLTFSDPLAAAGAGLTATGPADSTRLDATVSGNRVTAAWPAALAAGRMTIAYRAVADDGHVMTGNVSFTIAAKTGAATPAPATTEAPPPSTAAESAQTEPAAVPPWVWLLGVVVLAGGVAALIGSRRNRP